MNPASKSSLPATLDPVAAAIIAQLKQEMGQAIAAKDQIIALSELKIQKLEEELRLERIKKYGLRSEKLSHLQLQLLDLEPAVSGDEVQGEIKRGPLIEKWQSRACGLEILHLENPLLSLRSLLAAGGDVDLAVTFERGAPIATVRRIRGSVWL